MVVGGDLRPEIIVVRSMYASGINREVLEGRTGSGGSGGNGSGNGKRFNHLSHCHILPDWLNGWTLNKVR